MTVNDLNEIIVRKARKQGITHWLNKQDYSEFAFKIVAGYIEKLGMIHPPLKINVEPEEELISLTSSELRSVISKYELFYTVTDYAALDYPEEHEDGLRVYSIETRREPAEIDDIIEEAIEAVNLRVMNELVSKHFEDLSRPHIEYILKKYGFHILRDNAKFRHLSYDRAASLMEYIEKNKDDFQPGDIKFIRHVFDFYHKEQS